jgi:hypothetical protein
MDEALNMDNLWMTVCACSYELEVANERYGCLLLCLVTIRKRLSIALRALPVLCDRRRDLAI